MANNDDSASHHSSHNDRQQVFRFRPGSILFSLDFSNLLRHLGHSPWFGFLTCPLHTSTFLPPFAPHPLRCLLAPMEALTPDTVTPPCSGIPDSCTLPSGHSASNHPLLPIIALSRHTSRCRSYGRLQGGKRFP